MGRVGWDDPEKQRTHPPIGRQGAGQARDETRRCQERALAYDEMTANGDAEMSRGDLAIASESCSYSVR